MSNRRKYEGEEELQLQLLDVSQDPAFGHPAPQRRKLPMDCAEWEFSGEEHGPAEDNKHLH